MTTQFRLLALVLSLSITLAATPAAKAAVRVSLEDDGICIQPSGEDRLVLTYPALLDAANKDTHPGDWKIDKGVASMTYPGGGQISAAIDGATVKLHFTQLPAEAKGLRMDMILPIAWADGGHWQMEHDAAQAFPKEFKDTVDLFRGSPKPLKLTTPGGASFNLAMPHGWHQLTDQRKWNTNSFDYMVSAQMPAEGNGEAWYVFTLDGGNAVPAAAKPKAAAAAALALKLANDGLSIDAGAMGHFNLQYPVLVGEKWDQIRKPIEVHVDGDAATIKFDAGASIALALNRAVGELTLTPANLPVDVKSLRMEMLVDFSFANGGSWKIGEGAETRFPAEKPDKPHLHQGNADQLTLRDAQGSALVIHIPQYSFQQLTDNREWNWKTFHWQFNAPNPGAGPMLITIGMVASASGAGPTVDQFGQSVKAEYPEKVKSLDELKQDVQADAAYFAGLHPPILDEFGGMPGSREKLGLKQTGFFHVEEKDPRSILVDPDGNAYFQLGICAAQPSDDYTFVQGRESIYEWLPEHTGEFASAWHPNQYWNPLAVSFHLVNVIRKFGQPYTASDYTARTIDRLRKWGFNSSGPFGAGDEAACRQKQFPHALSLPLATWDGFPELPGAVGAFDPFDPDLRALCDKNFAARVAPAANDPLIIGYFLNNEPLYEQLPAALPALAGKYVAKQRLAKMLEEKYQTIAAFNAAWAVSFASFAEVADQGLSVKTDAAKADVRQFTELFLETYFQLITETFHKYDQHHLLLGNRLQPGTINNEALCRLSGKYMDVVSFNYYTHGVDKTLLNRIHQWTGGRPMLLSEFYFSSPADSGLPGGGKDVASQLERGLAYRNYVEQSASLGYVVGIEWFTLIDQSFSGRWFDRFNGENANSGLISVADRPWKTMLGEMMKTNYDVYAVLFGQRAPFVFDDPRFTTPRPQ